MKSALNLEQDEPVYGDYPALYALGIVTPVNAASRRRAQARGFTLVALLGVAALTASAAAVWFFL
jgi:hypothetical protein